MIHVASSKRRDCTSATRTNNNTIVLNAIAIQNMETRYGPTPAATSTALSTRTSASSSTNHNHKNICIFAVERMGVAPWRCIFLYQTISDRAKRMFNTCIHVLLVGGVCGIRRSGQIGYLVPGHIRVCFKCNTALRGL